MSNIEQRIAVLEQKIQDIDAERESLFQELSKLKDQHNQQQQSLPQLKTGAHYLFYATSLSIRLLT